MKKIIPFLVLMLVFAFAASAQLIGKTPEERAEHKTKQLNNSLSNSRTLPLPLTADQTTKVKASFLTYEQAVHPIRQKHEKSADKTKMKQDMKPYKDKLDADLKTTLTQDQYTRYQNLTQPKSELAYFAD